MLVSLFLIYELAKLVCLTAYKRQQKRHLQFFCAYGLARSCAVRQRNVPYQRTWVCSGFYVVCGGRGAVDCVVIVVG